MLVEQQCDRIAGQCNRLPGSSEVIESPIGKGKRLTGTSEHNNNLTGDILWLDTSAANLSALTLWETLNCRRLSETIAPHELVSWVKEVRKLAPLACQPRPPARQTGRGAMSENICDRYKSTGYQRIGQTCPERRSTIRLSAKRTHVTEHRCSCHAESCRLDKLGSRYHW